jgi:glucose/mannose-6-phosphate isomerase
MLDKIDGTPENIVQALADFKRVSDTRDFKGVENAVLAGVGTSAVAAEISLNWLSENVRIPMTLIRDSRLPGYADSRTVVVAVSYSGETQETLEILLDAYRRRCLTFAISSGGKMKETSERLRMRHIGVKAGFEPRTAFPFLLVPTSLVLSPIVHELDLTADLQDAAQSIRDLRKTVGWSAPCDSNPAKQLALNILGTIPVVYAFRRNGGLARRMKNQLNENSKMPAIFNLLPECCHNEFEAWGKSGATESEFSFIFLRPDEDKDEAAMIEEAKKILSEAGMTRIFEVEGVGETRVSKLLSIVYFTDYVTFYLSVLRKIDPSPWERVQELKKRILHRTCFQERFKEQVMKITS